MYLKLGGCQRQEHQRNAIKREGPRVLFHAMRLNCLLHTYFDKLLAQFLLSRKWSETSVLFTYVVRSELTFTLFSGIPSLRTRSSLSCLSRYGWRLNARSISHTSLAEKVVRCRFFASWSELLGSWSGSLSQSLLELVMSEQRLGDLANLVGGSIGTVKVRPTRVSYL